MADESSIFGSKPEHVKRLFQYVFEQPAAENHAPQATSIDTIAEKPGGRIDRYLLQRVLGEGGMGIVFLADQEEPVKRQVALKVIKPGMDSKRVIARFKAEQQTLAMMEHPHIAHVYDAGLTLSGRPYFVMEYVQGLPITEYCDKHKLTIKDRLNLFMKVCKAVQHAHQKGIIHRDIKPSNILVSIQDDQAVPKIIDFGVAKAVAQKLTEQTLATVDNQLLGTPEYMSPEQADMASEDIDTRSDVYSLGVLLYVLLTGILPFDSDSLREGGIDHIRKVIRETDPKTPSTRMTKLSGEAKTVAENRRIEITALVKCLKKELEWIPLKAMRKERAERYQSTSELAEDIRNYLTGNPLIAGPPSKIYPVKKFVRRNRILVGGITVVIGVFIAGIVVSMIFAIGQVRALEENQLITDFLENDVLGSADQVNLEETTVIYTLDTASNSLAEGKFKDKPLIEARICMTLGITYTNLGEYEKGERHIRRSTEIYRQHYGEAHPDTLKAMRRIAWFCHKLGRFRETERIYTRILQIGKGVQSVGEQVATMNMLGSTYNGLGKQKQAELLYEEILQIVESEMGGKHSLLPYIKGNLAVSYLKQGRYDEAEQIYKELIRVDEDAEDFTGINPGLYKSLGYTYKEQGRYEEAERLLEEALKAIRLKLGDKHPQILPYMLNLAQVHIEQEHNKEAEKLLLEAIDGPCVKFGDNHPRTLKSINNLIELYEAWDKPEKAKEWRVKLPQKEAAEE